jgi:hypothetical protein
VKGGEMRGTGKRAVSVTDKLVQERIKLLEADPEYIDLCNLVPKVLGGKESGKDFHGVTSDFGLYESKKDNGTILLSKSDWDKYEKFGRLCEKLAQKYKLHWVAIEDLAMGVKHPQVAPRLSETITAHMDPIIYPPKPFDPNKHYIAKSNIAPPSEAIEIMRVIQHLEESINRELLFPDETNEKMRRIQNLEQRARDEIRAYLYSLFKDKFGCRVVELLEAPQGQKGDDIEISISIKVPVGYTAREVGNVYRNIDNRRRQILTALGKSIPRRRRQSKTLMEAESLELLLPKKDVGILGIVDERFGAGGEDKRQKKSIINMRYRGRKLLNKRLQAP